MGRCTEACNELGGRVERRKQKDLVRRVGMLSGRFEYAWCRLADARKAWHPAVVPALMGGWPVCGVQRREEKDLAGSVGMLSGRRDDAGCHLVDAPKAWHTAQRRIRVAKKET